MDEKISPRVRQFIHSTINSVEQLEVLLFVMSNQDRSWSAVEVSERTRMAPESVAVKLDDLLEAKLLVREGSELVKFRYAPNSNSLAQEVAESLDKAYRERKDSIIQLIYSRPLENIRVLADAFRLRSQEDE